MPYTPMKAPRHYYYQENSSESIYGHEPIGVPDFLRLIRGQAWWLQETISTVLEKKALVINDPLAYPCGNLNQCIVLAERISALLQEGFKVYSYDNGVISPFQTTKIGLNALPNPVPAATADNIVMRNATQQLKLNPNKILVLNQDEMRKLVIGNETDYSHLSDFKHIDLQNSNISGPVFDHLLEKKCEEIESINVSFCANLKDAMIPQHIKLTRLHTLTVGTVRSGHVHQPVLALMNKSHTRRNELTPEAIACLIAAAENLEHLDLTDRDGVYVGIKWTPKAIDWSILSSFKHWDNIKTLNLGKTCCDTPIMLKPLSALETLDLHGSTITMTQLSELLSDASQLKILHLRQCTFSGDAEKPFSLPNLTTLDLSWSNITWPQLERLLSNAPNLRSLKLDYYLKLGEERPQQKLHLPMLEILDLCGSNPNHNQIQALIMGTNRLKELHLKDCRSMRDDTFNGFHARMLEKLNLCGSNISSRCLSQLLSNTTRLKELNLRCCLTTHYEKTVFDGFNASNMESLNLSETTLSLHQLLQLLRQATRLMTLNINMCSHLNAVDVNDLSIIDLPSLTTLNAYNTTLNPKILTQLLASTKHLEGLCLNNYLFDMNDGVFHHFKSTSLRNLQVDSSNISLTTLLQILADASKLVSLSLQNCRNIAQINGVSNHEFNFPSLKSILFCNVLPPSAILFKLLKSTPHLEMLSLSNCNNRFSQDLLNYLASSSLITLDCYGTSISSYDIYRLLMAYPRLQRLILDRCFNLSTDIPDDLPPLALKRLSLDSLQQGRTLPVHPKFLKKIKAKTTGLYVNYPDWALDAQSNHATEGLGANSGLEYANHQSLPTTGVRGANSKLELDADTRFYPDEEQTAKHVFYSTTPPDPDVASYRLTTFNSIDIKPQPCSQTGAFILKNTPLLTMEKHPIRRSNTELYSTLATPSSAKSLRFYGKHTFILTQEWQALPSISPHERLTDYQLNSSVNVEIEYSKRDNLYYIRAASNAHMPPQAVTIGFMLEDVPKQVLQALPEDIQAMIETCKNFKAMDLDMTGVVHPTGMDYLRALQTQKVGACRHRALVFKDWMTQHHPKMPTRIVTNDVHAFVEIQQGNQWVTCDLGGYPTKLIVNKPLSPEIQADNATEVCQHIVTINETPIPSVIKTFYFPSEKSPERHFETAIAYAQHLITDEWLNQLIVNTDSQMLAGIRYHLQYVCQHTQRPCFYVHSPDDLICSAPYIQRQDDDTGTLKKGPGGPLHDFLMAHAEDHIAPVIIINYEQFSASDVVKCNALLDPVRRADGTLVPFNAKIIGLINPKKPDAYNGADFYSRFDKKIYNIPLNVEQLTIPASAQEGVGAGVSIEFYNDSAWEACLLGQWILERQSLRFKESEFIRALISGQKTIHFHNAPWEDESFKCFWETALLKRSIEWNGRIYPLPDEFSLTKGEGYVFSDEMRSHITLNGSNELGRDLHVLNPGTLHRFFNEYLCDNHQQLIKHHPGIIESHRGKTLSLFVSHPLTIAAWAKLLDACITHNVTLNLSLANGVNLPDECHSSMNGSEPTCLPSTNATIVLHSSDVDLTLARICNPKQIIIDISEVEPSNLLKKINGVLNETTYQFEFTEEEGALLHELSQGKTVILKGQFSENLIHALTEMMWQRISQSTPPGRLLIVTEHENLFPIIPEKFGPITADDKKRMLAKEFPSLKASFDDASYSELSYAKLRAMCRYSLSHPTHDPLRAWVGMESLPTLQWSDLGPIDLSHAAEKTAEFNRQRLEAVQHALEHAPIIFLSGMTGVGKTTFIDKTWRQVCGALHIGESKLRDWALDASPGIKTLFIDEATITSRGWSEFEGLFHNPRGILIDNRWFPLTSEHKVIFAGNPVSYGGERQMPSLFKRQGGSIIFDPMPMAYIYHELLRPVLEGLTADHTIIAQPILKVAQYLTSLSRNHVLISPRELVTMALFTANYCQAHPDADPAEVSAYYAYALSEPFVPDASKEDFKRLFERSELSSQHPLKTPSDFLINDSNRKALNALSDFLTLRTLRQKMDGNPVQLYGGLGGLVLEGEPGIGKTQLVVNALLAHGLTQASITHEHALKQVFYVMPVTMPLSEKRRLLLQAFHEGAVVVIDEMNSSPMMERLLNDLLMGRSPEGERPKRPGFTIIATQNSAAFNSNTAAGRKEASHAIQHRMQKITVPHYTKQEMVNILVKKGLRKDISQDMVDEYMARREASKAGGPLPTLCFRDVLKRAEWEVRRTPAKINEMKLFNRLLQAMDILKTKINALPKEQHDDHTKASYEDLSQFCQMFKKTYGLVNAQTTIETDISDAANAERIAVEAERIAMEAERIEKETEEKMDRSQVAGGGAMAELPEELTAATKRASAEAARARLEADAAKARAAVERRDAPVINHHAPTANQNLRPQDSGNVPEKDKNHLGLSSVDASMSQARNIFILLNINIEINNHGNWKFDGLVGKSTYVADDGITPIPKGVRQILDIIKDDAVSDADKILNIREIAEAKKGWRGLSVLQLGLFTRSDDTKNFYKMIVDLIDRKAALSHRGIPLLKPSI